MGGGGVHTYTEVPNEVPVIRRFTRWGWERIVSRARLANGTGGAFRRFGLGLGSFRRLAPNCRRLAVDWGLAANLTGSNTIPLLGWQRRSASNCRPSLPLPPSMQPARRSGKVYPSGLVS